MPFHFKTECIILGCVVVGHSHFPLKLSLGKDVDLIPMLY